MGIFDRVKGLVFEESVEEVQEQQAQETGSTGGTPQPPPKTPVRPAAVIDDEFYAELKKDVDDDSPQAYRSFMAKLKSLADLGLNRGQMIKAAFKTSAVSKDELLAALTGRKRLLDKEQMEFESALNTQTRDEIEAKAEEAEGLGRQLETEEAELKRIIAERESRIESLKTKKQELEASVASGRKMQEKAKQRFAGARQKLEGEIDEEIREIEALLGKE